MKQKIQFVLCLLFGLMFINSGLNKIFNYIPIPPDMPEAMVNMNNALMAISWLIPLVAVAEIIGGILFILPKFRALGAVILFPILVGILLTHITVAPTGIPIAIILLAIEGWVVYDNREKYMAMIR
jgi:uncharacterized membrane protein YphA (DoxX/SURF4 family)